VPVRLITLLAFLLLASACARTDQASRQAPAATTVTAEETATRNIETWPIHDQQGADSLCPQVAASVGGRWNGKWSRPRPGAMATCGVVNIGSLPTRPISVEGQYEVVASKFNGVVDARQTCLALAQARSANWTGLWWSPHGGESVCVLAPRRNDVAEAPLVGALGCGGELCNELPLRTKANGVGPVAIHERPDEGSRIIAQVSPGEDVTLFDTIYIQTHSHRGIVRRATNGLAVGDVVFPHILWGDEPFPWRARPPGPDETSYEVSTAPNGVIETVPIDHNEPYISWMPLPPLRGPVSWVLLETSKGVKGWAAEFTLGIDFQYPDENE
jgi:hypothetical protein